MKLLADRFDGCAGRAGVLAGGLLSLAGCVSDQSAYSEGSGELGKASLLVPCSEDDAACAEGESRLAPDVPIAVGASFPIEYEGQVPQAPTGKPSNMILFSASPDMLSLDDQDFIAWLPGHVAVLARTEEGTVTDFAHFSLQEINQIELETGTETGLAVGEHVVCSATPHGADGRILGGRVAYGWQVEGTAVEISAQSGRTVTLVAREPGTVTLRAQASEAVGEATITVEGAP